MRRGGTDRFEGAGQQWTATRGMFLDTTIELAVAALAATGTDSDTRKDLLRDWTQHIKSAYIIKGAYDYYHATEKLIGDYIDVWTKFGRPTPEEVASDREARRRALGVMAFGATTAFSKPGVASPEVLTLFDKLSHRQEAYGEAVDALIALIDAEVKSRGDSVAGGALQPS